jgi:hypothetical protein
MKMWRRVSMASAARIHIEGGAVRPVSPLQRGSMASAVRHNTESERGA